MNQLYKLVRKLSPTGVHFCSLEDVCRIETGKQINKGNLLSEGNYPVLNGGISPSGYWHEYNTDANTIAISQGGASAGYVNYITTPFWAGAHCYVVFLKTEKVLYKFLYYFIKNNQEKLMNSKQGAGIPGLNRKAIYSLNIPLPPLPIQQEIVRILDTFTNLTAELTAELTARRKQYEYYRDELLTFGEDVSRVQLGLVCDFKYGKGNNIPNETGEYPVYGCNGIVSTTNTFNSEDAPIIGHIGSAGVVNWGKGKHFVTYNGTICRVKADKIRSRYAYYVLNSLHLERFVKGSQPFLSYGDFSKGLIPLPPIERQDEIVRILDQFDYFCNDLTSGIPAEISARQKQYEYYRNQLLTFKQIGG